MGDLMPCPFCGGDAHIKETRDGPSRPVCVFCSDCEASMGDFGLLDDAIAAWNQRSAPPSNGDLMEEVARMFRRDFVTDDALAQRMAAAAIAAWNKNSAWRPIADVPSKGDVLLYFPARDFKGRNKLDAMVQIGRPEMYPNRPPTHFMPLPQPPETDNG